MDNAKICKPVTCQEVKTLISKVLRGAVLTLPEGSDDRMDLVEAHIEGCEQCSPVYSDAMDELVKQSSMSGSVPPVPMLPKTLSLSFLQAAEEAEAAASGTRSPKILARLEQLCEHPDRDVSNAAKRVMNGWAPVPQPRIRSVREQDKVREKLVGWQLFQDSGLDPALSTLGEGTVQAQQTVRADDQNGSQIDLTILSGPVVTKDGHFRFHVHGAGDGQIGMQLECGIDIDNEQPLMVATVIHAASNGQGWEASFDAVLLTDPALRASDCDIPLKDLLTIQVRPSTV